MLCCGTYLQAVYADTDRDALIQQELDCVQENKNIDLSGSNHCYRPDSSNNEHVQIVNQVLDEVEGVVPAQVIEQNSPTRINGQEKNPHYIKSNTKQNLPTSIIRRTNTFSISYQTFFSHYSEPEKTRTLTGVWQGVEGAYTFRPPKGNLLNTPVFNYYAFETFYARGSNKIYENEQRASDNSITKLIIKKIPGYMFEERFLLGRDYLPLSTLRVTPYTGFGLRYKTDHSAGHYNVFDNYLGSPVVALGYNFSDIYNYVPLGINLDLAQKNNDQVSLNLEYDFLVNGYERDDYSNFDQFTLPIDGFTNQNLRYNLDHGWGIRSSLKFLKHLSLVDIYLEPYIRFWHIAPSEISSGLVGGGNFSATTNKNNTLEAGSILGVLF